MSVGATVTSTLNLFADNAGAALNQEMAERAMEESRTDPRYCWLGELPRWQARRLIARSRLMVLSSVMEGGANVISEALAASTPILSSRIEGSVGLLGEEYPGYFEVGDSEGLAKLRAALPRCHITCRQGGR